MFRARIVVRCGRGSVQHGCVALAVDKHHRPIEISTFRWSDRKSTRLNSSHVEISYAVFCLKKKNLHDDHHHLPNRVLIQLDFSLDLNVERTAFENTTF